MTLEDLIGEVPGARLVATRPGALFCAIPGIRADGHDFAAAAVARGAAALLVERPLDLPVPQVVVDDARLGAALAASAVHGHPSRDLQVVGITGTNGKTTCAVLLRSVLEASGRPCGLIGTIEARVGGATIPAAHTTPDPVELQALLARMRDAGD